jgi:hypothetical protein
MRATMSLAWLMAKDGCVAKATAMLSDMYNWFNEGFETTDLKEAKVQLDELRIEGR